MSNDQPVRRPPAKSSGGGAPMGSTISIVIAVVAVVVGFIILRNINSSGSAASPSPNSIPTNTTAITIGTGTTIGGSATTAPNATTATTGPLVQTAQVVVANASGQKGAASFATTELKAVGFTMGAPTDAFGPEKSLPTTKVYYVAGAEATAASVAQMYSTAASPVHALAMPTPIPVKGASIGSATVLVMIGKDLANKALPAIAVANPASVATTIAG